MISYVSSSIYSVNSSKHGSLIAPTDEIKKFQENIGNGIDINETSKEEYHLLDEQKKKNQEHKSEERKPQTPNDVAMKLALGEKLSQKEDDFLSEKYPKLKKYAEYVKEQGEDLREKLENAPSKEESKKVILNAMENVSKQSQKGVISDFVVRMQMSSIENVKNNYEKSSQRFNDVKLNISPGSLVDAFA
ncbi:MAG: hypothetical protein R3Y64_05820 [Peptostreptococcaceae bacterium]